MEAKLIKKLDFLKNNIKSLGSVLVAFSGGVDSTLLLKVSLDLLSDNVLAVTAKSPSFPGREIKKALSIAKALKSRHLLIESFELKNPKYVANNKERCYFCKKELFSELKRIAENHGLKFVIDGTNYDDINDYRPGSKAAAQLQIISPLKDAKIGKEEIRALSRHYNLPNSNDPSFACLASRIPYGTEISEEILSRIDYLETLLKKKGFTQVRVRHHGNMARIEVLKEELPKMFGKNLMEEIIIEFKKSGYLFITADLEGYRTGSMNTML